MNNPVSYIDPDGREVFISGVLSQEALKQLQSRVGDRISLSMDDAGKVSYTVNTDKKLKGDAKRMARMIDDGSIKVNLVTTNQTVTSTGNLMVGGAFMGNTVTTGADGNTVLARQEVNPTILGSADEHVGTPGKLMMHETTEAYQGARISQRLGVGVGMATATEEDNPNSVYNRAHGRATSQTLVRKQLYDSSGRKIRDDDIHKAVRAEWYVTKNGKIKIIQTLP